MSNHGAVTVLGLLLGTFLVQGAAAQVDVEPYVAEDSFGDIKVSPTGAYYAATLRRENQTGLMVMNRSAGKLMASFKFSRDTHVADFWWVNPERVLMSIAESFGTRDDPQPTGELYAINADGGKRELLVGWRVQTRQTGTRISRGKKEERVAAYLIDPLADDDRNVLISVHQFTSDPYTWVEEMDVYTGERSRVTEVPVARARFVTDNKGIVRFAVGAGSDNVSKLYYRSGEDAEWQLINDEASSRRVELPLGFSDDGSVAYLQVEQSIGPDAIVAMDVASEARKQLLQDDTVDPRPIYRDGWGAPIGVRFLGAEPRTAFFDEKTVDAHLYRSLKAAFPGGMVEIPSATADGQIKLIFTSSDVNPGSFYAFDTVAKKTEFILVRREKIDPQKMAPMRPITMKARDGLDLHGFLTIPRDTGGKSLPLVVVPHGGPFGIFDRWGFDSDTQLLAEAGYAVLSINFRGSGNYGRAFQQAGAREWGGTMQDDLTDATRWAIQEGIADQSRICIYGASYGAYAALMGVAKEPDLYRCAVGYVGVYDLQLMRREDSKNSRSLETWTREWVGADESQLAAASPNRIADRIKAPVFLAAGGEDSVAPIEHSELMERALTDAGVPVETLYYPNEGHGFYTVEHRREFYLRLLDFLGRHLGEANVAP